jgi:hypothetical protein
MLEEMEAQLLAVVDKSPEHLHMVLGLAEEAAERNAI